MIIVPTTVARSGIWPKATKPISPATGICMKSKGAKAETSAVAIGLREKEMSGAARDSDQDDEEEGRRWRI